ncbi:MAG: SIMPL domain-containing protein [Proteobacteria bacterium]|nr:SIMPL domain-containing protein [Pseudomonadota bacterium]
MATQNASMSLPRKETFMMKLGLNPATAVARQRGQSTVAFLALGAALAVGLVLSAWIVASSLERIKLAGDRITVKGYAEEKVVSDAGTWRAIVSVRAPDLSMAYGKLDADSARVVKYMESVAGADAGRLQQGTVNTQTVHEFGPGGVQTGRVLGYELSRQFEFSSKNVAQIGTIATRASRLISDGIAISAMPPQYFFTDLNAVKVRLIGAATRDSLLRAQQFAANSGVTVGPLRSASQGVFQITSPNSTETADYGSYDTSTVEKLVKAVVTVEYAVVRK